MFMRHLLAPAAVSATGDALAHAVMRRRGGCAAIRGSWFMPHAPPVLGPTPMAMPRPIRMRTQITLARLMIVPYNRTCQSSANDGVKECL